MPSDLRYTEHKVLEGKLDTIQENLEWCIRVLKFILEDTMSRVINNSVRAYENENEMKIQHLLNERPITRIEVSEDD